jgi:hypothetical protein
MLFDVLSYLWYDDTVELAACSVEIASGDSAVLQAFNPTFEPISLPKSEVRVHPQGCVDKTEIDRRQNR